MRADDPLLTFQGGESTLVVCGGVKTGDAGANLCGGRLALELLRMLGVGEVALADLPGLAVGLLDMRLLPWEPAEVGAFRGSLNRDLDIRAAAAASSSLEDAGTPARPLYLRFRASRLRFFFFPIFL